MTNIKTAFLSHRQWQKSRLWNCYLVFLTPGPSSSCNKAKKDEGILTTDNKEDGKNLQVGEQATHEP